MNAHLALDQLWMIYQPLCNAHESRAMAAYMKDHFEFLGIKKPIRASAHKAWMKEMVKHPQLDTREFIEVLWNQPEREYHYFAMEFAERRKLYNAIEDIHLIEWLILTNSWWDSVDFLATHLAGSYFKKHPSQVAEVIPRWISSPNFWLNRSAILFQLKYKTSLDEHWLTASILPHKDSTEFFIRKAIGWVLREHSHYNPQFVRAILRQHAFSGLTQREATKYLNP